jgi:hypothetical protein
MGMVKSKKDAIDLIAQRLSIAGAPDVSPERIGQSSTQSSTAKSRGNLQPYF